MNEMNGQAIESLLVRPGNVKSVLGDLDGRHVAELLVDVVDTCNAECVYCPHGRSNKRLELDDFRALISRLRSVGTLQIGCSQEPTADPRLPEFFRIFQDSHLSGRELRMITNGTLLHRFDTQELVRGGLKRLTFSIDTLDPVAHGRLRRGVDLGRVIRSIRAFARDCPEVALDFSIVVSSESVPGMEELIAFGAEVGVGAYVFRELIHTSNSPRRADYFEAMTRLLLPPGEFGAFERRVRLIPTPGKYVFLPSETQHGWRKSVSSTEGELQSHRFLAGLDWADLPCKVGREAIEASVDIENRGSTTWAEAPAEHHTSPIRVGARLFGGPGEDPMTHLVREFRAPLPASLASGEKSRVSFKISRDDLPVGKSFLVVNMVWENRFWFSADRAPPLVLELVRDGATDEVTLAAKAFPALGAPRGSQ